MDNSCQQYNLNQLFAPYDPQRPTAYARIRGGKLAPCIDGNVFFYQLVNLINQLVENELQLDLSGVFIQIDYQLVIAIYLGALCFGLCSSYIPAFLAGRLDPIKALKQPNY